MQLQIDVDRLARPEGRMVGTPGHDDARDYLVGRVGEIGLRPLQSANYCKSYTGGGQRFDNLVGVAPGDEAKAAPIVLGAHYDTCGPLPGADDNAAAVSIALEIGRRLVATPAARPVWICLFDAEEPPYFQTRLMGSTTFFHTQQPRMPHCAIVMDLVGHDVPLPGAEASLFTTGAESHPDLVAVIEGLVEETPLDLVATLNAYIGDMSDYHAYRLGGVPYLFFSCGRWEHYHAPTDTPDRLNYMKMAHIADVVETAVRATAQRELAGGAVGADTLELELATLRRVTARHPLLGGLPLVDRSSVDAIVKLLVGQMGL